MSERACVRACVRAFCVCICASHGNQRYVHVLCCQSAYSSPGLTYRRFPLFRPSFAPLSPLFQPSFTPFSPHSTSPPLPVCHPACPPSHAGTAWRWVLCVCVCVCVCVSCRICAPGRGCRQSVWREGITVRIPLSLSYTLMRSFPLHKLTP